MEGHAEDICNLKERVAVLEARYAASEKALELSRQSISKSNLGAIATFVMSVLALTIEFLRK